MRCTVLGQHHTDGTSTRTPHYVVHSRTISNNLLKINETASTLV